MPRKNEPWFRKERKTWCVTIDGKMINLGKNRKEAFQKFHRIKAETKRTIAESDSLVHAIDSFLVWTKDNRSEGTTDFYFGHLQHFCNWLQANDLQAIEILELNPAKFTEYLGTVSTGRKGGAVQSIKRVFNWAAKQGLIEISPLRHLEKPSSSARKNLVTPGDYDKMLNLLTSPFKEVIEFAWHTGARPQEIWKIQSRHVDRENRRIILSIEETKRKKKARSIYCNKSAWAVVEKLLRDDGYLFVNSRGVPWNKSSANCRLRHIETKLGKKYALYDFRHAWITRHLVKGLSIYDVAELAGTSVEMIEKHYSDVASEKKHLRQAIDDHDE